MPRPAVMSGPPAVSQPLGCLLCCCSRMWFVGTDCLSCLNSGTGRTETQPCKPIVCCRSPLSLVALVPAGECENNKVFMIGSRSAPGHCVKVSSWRHTCLQLLLFKVPGVSWASSWMHALPLQAACPPGSAGLMPDPRNCLSWPSLQACDACLEIYSGTEQARVN
jgi:hypothetical protein